MFVGQMVDPPVAPVSAPSAPGRSLKGQAEIVEPSRAEQAIARRAAEIRATVPDLELSTTLDADPARRRAQAADVSLGAVAVAAISRALRSFPRANGAYRDGHYELYSRINVAVMLSGPQAPTSATLFDADARSLTELDDELSRLRDRARRGELTSPEQAGATFTLHDLTEHGIDRGVPLVISPQAAALSLGAIRRVAVVGAEGIQPGHMWTLTLAADHRILFGDAATGFLAAVGRELAREPDRPRTGS
jgi:pyruvate dehydrogenase E2 component (dihydrolipoamide acetyltransferase)